MRNVHLEAIQLYFQASIYLISSFQQGNLRVQLVHVGQHFRTFSNNIITKLPQLIKVFCRNRFLSLFANPLSGLSAPYKLKNP